ncbi:MAG TPA: PAS domain-containing sensor histidine kinase, partial [Chitinophagaceae bacterium]|nr:PAS domain-containing sensor histidine kinase [Chitinophagaceae bacterium]
MAYTVKQRIRWGTLFLFVLLLLSGGVGIFYLVRLKNDSKLILKDNYESLDYSHSMTRILDGTVTTGSMKQFDSLLTLQENNLTEAGEQEATMIIRRNFNEYRNGNAADSIKRNIAAGIQRILSVNMSAIEMKNARAQKTADNALTYIS